MGVFHDWRPDRLFMFLTAYLDESGTHGDASRCVVIGCYIATAAQWRDFDLRWRKLRTKYGFDHFHAKDFRKGKGAFRGWPAAKQSAFLVDQDRLISKRTQFGFAFVLDLAEYKTDYLQNTRPKKIQLDSAYGLCFRFIIGWIARTLGPALSDDKFSLLIIMEAGHKNSGDIVRILKEFHNTSGEAWKKHIRDVIFSSKGCAPGLEIADMLSYVMYRHANDPSPPPVAEMDDMNSAGINIAKMRAERSGQCPILRGRIDAASLRKLRANVDERDAARLAFGRQAPRDRGPMWDADPSRGRSS
jgi:hypothetical protein